MSQGGRMADGSGSLGPDAEGVLDELSSTESFLTKAASCVCVCVSPEQSLKSRVATLPLQGVTTMFGHFGNARVSKANTASRADIAYPLLSKFRHY
eukprot:2110730-Amphidinium_carterae.1